MKYIQKTAEPAEFTRWKEDNPAATYDDFSRRAREQKKTLKKALLEEQGCICCYCERQISDKNSHIEHFRPKGNPLYADLQLDYNNLHASCLAYPEKSQPTICGVAKQDKYSPDLISPTEAGCAAHFKYRIDGSIYAADPADKRASYTINLLKLNDAFLRNLRKAVLKPFLDPSLSGKDLDTMRTHYLLKSADGKYRPFYSMIEAS